MTPNPSLQWPITWPGVQLIAEREGCRLRAYRCPAGRWTCGWGETDGVGPTTAWTQDFADQRLCDSLAVRAHAVRDLCTMAPSENQLAAMVSLSYNAGLEGFRGSSVLKAHNRGDTPAAARAFGLWNKARINGRLQVMAGLTARRAAEAALYLQPDPDAPPETMPQAVAAEPTLSASPTTQAATVAAGAGVLQSVSEARDQLGPVAEAVQGVKAMMCDVLSGLNIPPEWVMPALLVGLGGLVLYRRLQQRRQGLA